MAKKAFLGIDDRARRISKIYLGVGGVARKVVRGYIGVGGKARPFFTTGLEYYGQITSLSSNRESLASTTIGEYALFGGGEGRNPSYNSAVDAYDKSLTQSVATALRVARGQLAATVTDNYALFGGGYCSSGDSQDVDAYNKTLTRFYAPNLSQVRHALSATKVGNYALFGGGYYHPNLYYAKDSVDAYDGSLTKITVEALSVARASLAAVTIGSHALFAGGEFKDADNQNDYTDVVDVYDESLTRTSATNLTIARGRLSATKVGNYALFGGGYERVGSLTYSSCKEVDAYDSSLTRRNPFDFAYYRHDLAATSVGKYALFSGGFGNSVLATTDAYDDSLTKVSINDMSDARAQFTATTIGKYALFGGGVYGSYTVLKTVEAYTAD
jgi:hypothetical protein